MAKTTNSSGRKRRLLGLGIMPSAHMAEYAVRKSRSGIGYRVQLLHVGAVRKGHQMKARKRTWR